MWLFALRAGVPDVAKNIRLKRRIESFFFFSQIFVLYVWLYVIISEEYECSNHKHCAFLAGKPVPFWCKRRMMTKLP